MSAVTVGKVGQASGGQGPIWTVVGLVRLRRALVGLQTRAARVASIVTVRSRAAVC